MLLWNGIKTTPKASQRKICLTSRDLLRIMKRREWKDRYIDRLVEMGLDRKSARNSYNAGIDSHDYDDSPEDAADDDASYWIQDTPR